MSADILTRMLEQVEAYAKFSRPPLHSFLVQQRGAIAAECYWWGYSATSYQPVFSVTKSVISALACLAIGDRKLALTDTLTQWFPEYAAGTDAGAITVQHLLTMTSGFAPLKAKLGGDDTLAGLVRRPLATPPGEQFHYDNEAVDLLVAVIERAVGEPTLDYACRRLFAPLGIWQGVTKSQRRRLWQVDRQGRVKGGHGLHLTAREMAASGQLYLQCGKWQGEPLIPAELVGASTTEQAAGGYPEFVKYGYLWWITSDSGGRSVFYASGRGGQYIYVVPALDLIMVCVSTSRNADGRPHRVMLARLATQFALSRG